MSEVTLAQTIFKNLIDPITRNYEIIYNTNKTLFAQIHDDYSDIASAILDKYKFIEDDAFIDESIHYANHGIMLKYNRNTETISLFLNKNQNFIELFLKSILVEDVSYTYVGKVKDYVLAKVHGNGIDDFLRYLTDQWYFEVTEIEPKDEHDDFKMKYIVNTGIINMIITSPYGNEDTLDIKFLLT